MELTEHLQEEGVAKMRQSDMLDTVSVNYSDLNKKFKKIEKVPAIETNCEVRREIRDIVGEK